MREVYGVGSAETQRYCVDEELGIFRDILGSTFVLLDVVSTVGHKKSKEEKYEKSSRN